MKYSQTLGIIFSILAIVICTQNWIYVPTIHLTLTGTNGIVNSDLNLGKPIKVQVFFSALLILFFVIKKVWAKRTNMIIAFLNLGFAIKTYILFSMCRLGECPTIYISLYALPALALLIMVATLLPKMEVSKAA